MNARASALFAVLAIHLTLLWLLVNSSATRAARESKAAPPTRITLRPIAASPPVAPAQVAIEAPARVSTPRPPTARPTRTREATSAPGITAMPGPRPEAALRPEPSASEASPLPSLLDTEATRRAIRASARNPALGDPRTHSARPDTPEARMAANFDTRLTEEELGDGRRRLRRGASCVIVTPSRIGQLMPFNEAAARAPSLVSACP